MGAGTAPRCRVVAFELVAVSAFLSQIAADHADLGGDVISELDVVDEAPPPAEAQSLLLSWPSQGASGGGPRAATSR